MGVPLWKSFNQLYASVSKQNKAVAIVLEWIQTLVEEKIKVDVINMETLKFPAVS